MKNVDAWRETKFTRRADGAWRANREVVAHTSWIMADLVAAVYEEAIAAHARGRLADLGCGAVPLYGLYRDRIDEVVCVDYPGSLHGVDHVDVFADLNEPLPETPELASASFDTVLATDLIEHLHTPQSLMDGAARLLRPGGKLILGAPFLYWLHEEPHDHHRYTRFALTRMAERAGLRVVSLTPLGGAPHVIADVAVKALAGRPWLAKPLGRLCAWALRRGPVARLGAAGVEKFPSAYVLVAERPSG